MDNTVKKAPLAQPVEAPDLNPDKCRFESYEGHQRTKEEQKYLIDSCRQLLLLFHPEAQYEMIPTDELLEDW